MLIQRDILMKFLITVGTYFIFYLIIWSYDLWSKRNWQCDVNTGKPYSTKNRISRDLSTLLKNICSFRFLTLCVTVLLPLVLFTIFGHIKIKSHIEITGLILLVIFLVFNWGLYELWKRYYPKWKNTVAILLIILFLSLASSN